MKLKIQLANKISKDKYKNSQDVSDKEHLVP